MTMSQPTLELLKAQTDRPQQPFTILVATAGDIESRGAILAAAALARRTSGRVEALTVVAPFPHTPPSGLLMKAPPAMDQANRQASVDEVKAQLAEVRGTRGWQVHSA